MSNILIIGATSAIAAECAKLWAAENCNFFLVARNAEKLQQVSKDLIARGASSVESCALDVNEFDKHQAVLNACYATLGKIDVALIAHGSLSDQVACEKDVQLTLREFSTNATTFISLLTLLANFFENQKSGTIAAISSIAGDRGRSSLYVYGCAKATISHFCAGLRGRLFKSGVQVLTIKPGYTATPMTQGLPLPKILVATPSKVAKDILHAIKRKKNVLYTPWFWLFIMTIIKCIPECIFKRMKI